MLAVRAQFEDELAAVCSEIKEIKSHLQKTQPINSIDVKSCDQLLSELQVCIDVISNCNLLPQYVSFSQRVPYLKNCQLLLCEIANSLCIFAGGSLLHKNLSVDKLSA